MLDEFVWGAVARISPEAPVPIVEVHRESSYPGGAANVARNLRSFTDSVTMLGVTGADASTIVETRIIAQRQQVVRGDREQRTITGSSRSDIMEKAKSLVARADAVLFEDYGKGFLDQSFVDAVLKAATTHGTLVTCDPNPKNPLEWPGIATIKPNRSEAFAAAGVPLTPPVYPAEEDAALLNVGRKLLERWNAGAVLITLSEQGMMLFRKDHPSYHAAGIVVGKLGTATCSREELEKSFGKHSPS